VTNNIKFPKWYLSWLTGQVIRTTTTFADRQPEQPPTLHAVETALVKSTTDGTISDYQAISGHLGFWT